MAENPIEPKWMHGKRRVEVEADGVLTAHELAWRVCSAFDCPHYEHLSLAEKSPDRALGVGSPGEMTSTAKSGAPGR